MRGQRNDPYAVFAHKKGLLTDIKHTGNQKTKGTKGVKNQKPGG